MADFLSRLVQSRLAKAGTPLEGYSRALSHSYRAHAPVFAKARFGQEYRRLARNPAWFSAHLVSNADLEGYSARQLDNYCQTLAIPSFANGMKRHALDEARHARIFTHLLFLLFPALETKEQKHKMEAFAPVLNPATFGGTDPDLKDLNEETMEEMLNAAILINLHEIKALVVEELLVPVLVAYGTEGTQSKIGLLARRLITDEVEHIRYSARFIETAMNQGYGDYVFDAMADFQRTLNLVTLEGMDSTNQKCKKFF
jgi:hypothetical protein